MCPTNLECCHRWLPRPRLRKQPRVFYGWWVVGACFFTSLYAGGVILFGFTSFFEPIGNEFGWSYAEVAFAASLLGLESGIVSPLAGMLVDRFGPRRLMFGGALVSGLGLIGLSRVTSLGEFYGAFIVISLGLSTGSSPVVLPVIVQWFKRKAGVATGITVTGGALGGLVVPLMTALIDTVGWRSAAITLGVAMWVIVLPLSLAVRHKPEQYGYLPDGEAMAGRIVGETISRGMDSDADVPGGKALRSSAFWHISLALLFQTFAVNAVLVHIMPYLGTIGVTRSTASLIAMATPVASIIGRLGFGWLGDRYDRKRLAVGGFVLTGMGLVFLGGAATAIWLIVPFAILFGIGWGSGVTLRVALVREHFGRSSFGTIHGFTMGVMTLGNIVGPLIVGWAVDASGSYVSAWFASVGLTALAVITLATTPPVRRLMPIAERPIRLQR